ncbi:MAG: hypothetical protein NTV86_15130 [Planctomycetota bacterium]|nr:hypothetical protein [Planctomycetota bacterium]
MTEPREATTTRREFFRLAARAGALAALAALTSLAVSRSGRTCPPGVLCRDCALATGCADAPRRTPHP